MKFCAVLGAHPSDTPGGAELQTQLIGSELARRGHEATYIAYDSETNRVSDCDGVTVHRLNPDGRRELVTQLRSKARDIDPDVSYFRNIGDVHLMGLFRLVTDSHITFNISHDAQCFSRFAGWPGKADETPLHTVYRRLNLGVRRSLLCIPDTVFLQTERQQRLLEENRGIDGVLTGNGHQVPEGEPEKRSPPVVLWLASIKKWKQPGAFIELAERCDDLDCEFWLVGRPSDRALAEVVGERASSLSNVEYLGGCTVEESDEYIGQASVFVNTSKLEGFPNTFIQSWFRRTPVVSLHADPVGESDGSVTGYYGLEDRDELVARVRELIRNHEYRRTVGAQAYRYACENHDIRIVVDRIEEGLPEHVLDCPSRP